MSTSYRSLLVDATQWHDGSGTISYSFQSRPADYYMTVDTDGDGIDDSYLVDGDEATVAFGANVKLNATLKAETEYALQAWSDVANLNVVAAPRGTVGDIAIGAAHFEDETLYGFVSNFPGVPGDPSPDGDLWLNLDNARQGKPAFGSDGMSTMVHELGHAFGLHHPDEDPNNDAGDPRNNNQWTVMSYIAHPGVDPSDDDGAYPVTPMVFDIQAIQALYGANLTTRAGNSRYISGDGAAFALDSHGRWSSGIYGLFTIWDAGGKDTIDASNQSGKVTIDLTPGHYSSIGGLADNVGLAAAVKIDGKVVNYIENAIGGAHSDVLIGNGADNLLKGNGGSDRFELDSAGKDSVDGGSGNDTAYWHDSFTGIDVFKGGAGTDTLVLDGDYAAGTTLRAASLSSVEQIKLAAGHDYYLIMADGDVADGATIRIDGTKLGSDDHLIIDGSLETDGAFHMLGGRDADVLFGGAAGDTLQGGKGADTLYGGGGGDALSGGAGADDFFYFATADSSRGKADRILDFGQGDVIDLAAIDANSTKSGDQAFHFSGGGGHAGDIVASYDAGNDWTVVNLYVNGGSSVDMRIVVLGEIDLGAGSFVL